MSGQDNHSFRPEENQDGGITSNSVELNSVVASNITSNNPSGHCSPSNQRGNVERGTRVGWRIPHHTMATSDLLHQILVGGQDENPPNLNGQTISTSTSPTHNNEQSGLCNMLPCCSTCKKNEKLLEWLKKAFRITLSLFTMACFLFVVGCLAFVLGLPAMPGKVETEGKEEETEGREEGTNGRNEEHGGVTDNILPRNRKTVTASRNVHRPRDQEPLESAWTGEESLDPLESAWNGEESLPAFDPEPAIDFQEPSFHEPSFHIPEPSFDVPELSFHIPEIFV